MLDQAIVIADCAGVIQIWNPAAETLFGYGAASAIGQSLDMVVPADYRAHHWRGFHAAMASDDVNIDRASANVPVLCRDGVTRRLAVRLLVLRDAKQRAVGAMAIFTPDDDEPSLPRL
jgi:PAS domain S-box-containing protein